MAAIDLTTLAKVKSHLGIKDADTTGDALLGWMITAVSKWFYSQVQREFKTSTPTFTFDGDGGQSVTLPQQPVTSVTSVTVDDYVIPARTVIGDDGYILDNGRVKLVGYRFDPGVANCLIVYAAGASAIPEDVEQAVIQQIAEVYRARDRAGLSSRTVPSGETVTFRPDGITYFVQSVIDTYKRVGGVAP
jgi:hypothetical protein